MKIETIKAWFVYGNVTFIVVAGFYVLYQLATRTDVPAEQVASIGAASIFAGFVGMAIQFLTGQEIATRATRAAAAATAATTAPAVTTTVTTEGPPATSSTTTSAPAAPAESVDLDEPEL